ncbi:MAG: MATE family efflux transporter [Bacillota bacterium]|jgi:putative MATE family efflux protein
MSEKILESKNMLDMTKGGITKKILVFAIPMLIGNIFQQLYNVVDSLVIGNTLGKEALAAVGVSFPVIFVLIALTIGLSMGATIVIAQYYGAKDEDNLRLAVGTTYIIIAVSSVILTVIGLIFTGPILNILQTPPEVYALAKSYMQIIFIGLIFFTGFNVISGILRGVGDSKTPLYFLIVATAINIVLDLVFVLIFHWGVAGVAVATVIAQAVSCILCLIYTAKISPVLALKRTNLVFNKNMLNKILKMGLPAGLQQTIIAMSIFITQALVNSFGSTTIAGYSLSTRMDSICIMFFITMGIVISTFTGQNIGANNIARVREGCKVGLKITLILSAVLGATLFFGRYWILGFFTPDLAVIEVGAGMFYVIAPFYFLIGLVINYSSVARGAGAAMAAMYITLVAQCARLPIAYWLVYVMRDVSGVWWSFVIGWAIGALISILYYRFGNWQNKALVRKHPPMQANPAVAAENPAK